MEMPVRLVLTGEPSILLIFVQLRQIGMEITQPPLRRCAHHPFVRKRTHLSLLHDKSQL